MGSVSGTYFISLNFFLNASFHLKSRFKSCFHNLSSFPMVDKNFEHLDWDEILARSSSSVILMRISSGSWVKVVDILDDVGLFGIRVAFYRYYWENPVISEIN